MVLRNEEEKLAEARDEAKWELFAMHTVMLRIGVSITSRSPNTILNDGNACFVPDYAGAIV